MALDHVPTATNMKSRAENAPLRFSLVSEILAADGISMDSGEVQQYAEILQRYCPYFCQFGFDLSDTLETHQRGKVSFQQVHFSSSRAVLFMPWTFNHAPSTNQCDCIREHWPRARQQNCARVPKLYHDIRHWFLLGWSQ